jgi:hypothetical protein
MRLGSTIRSADLTAVIAEFGYTRWFPAADDGEHLSDSLS